MTPSSANVFRRFAQQRCAPRLRALSALGLVLSCAGGEAEDGVDGPPPFSGGISGQGGAMTTPVGGPGSGGGAANPGGNNMELGFGGALSVSPQTGEAGAASSGTTPPVTMTQACPASTSSCQGNAIVSCNLDGTALTMQTCGADTSCAIANGVPTCQPLAPPACTANQTFCNTANVIGRCNAEGTAFTTERCADGMNCGGAGVCEPVSCSNAGLQSSNNAGATIYFFGQGTDNFGDVACGFGIQVGADDGTGNPNNGNNGVGDAVNGIENPAMFAALATGSYQAAGACGACAEINYQGRSVRVTVADECPANVSINAPCRENTAHMDLSRAAWNALTNNAPANRINGGITWRFVPCNLTTNVQFELSKPDDIYWNEFVVVGHRYPIVRAEVLMEDGPAPGSGDGRWVAATRQNYNYWRPPEGNPDGDMGTYRVRVTDINGSIIEEQLELQGGLQGGSGQFGCQ